MCCLLHLLEHTGKPGYQIVVMRRAMLDHFSQVDCQGPYPETTSVSYASWFGLRKKSHATTESAFAAHNILFEMSIVNIILTYDVLLLTTWFRMYCHNPNSTTTKSILGLA